MTEAEPAEDGGIMNSLWNLLEAYGLGCRTMSFRAIPILQKRWRCVVFDINPYRLSSADAFSWRRTTGFGVKRSQEERR